MHSIALAARRRRTLLLLLLLLAGSLARPKGTPLQAQTPVSESATSDPTVPPLALGRDLTLAADPALTAPPAEAQALNPASPGWVTGYGTAHGRATLAPSPAPSGYQPNGLAVPVGRWDTLTALAGGGGVSGIAEVPDGRVFVGVPGAGLRVYGRLSDGSYGWSGITATAGGLASNAVTGLALYNGEIWVGTAANGISVLNPATMGWRSFTTANSPLPSNAINRLSPVADHNNFRSIWVSTQAGAANYLETLVSGTWNIITTANGLQRPKVRDVAVQTVGATTYTWFSTYDYSTDTNHYGSIARWDGASWSYFNQTTTGSCTFDTARRIVVDHTGAVWFAAQAARMHIDAQGGLDPRGVCRFAANAWTPFTPAQPGLPTMNAVDLALDGAKRVWMTFGADSPDLARGGAAVYEQGKWAFFTATAGGLASNNLPVVQAVGERVWFGHGDMPSISVFTPGWQRSSASELGGVGAIQAMLIESSVVWAGVGPGLAWRTSGGWTYRAIPGNTATVTALARSADGKLRIATLGGGIWSWDGVSFANQQTTASGLPTNTIYDLHLDQGGRFWAATQLGLALEANGTWLTFTAGNSLLPGSDIRALTSDMQGRLWIGTAANGLARFDPSAAGDAAWALIGQPLIPGNAVRGLATDEQGVVWVATTAGAGSWNPINGTWNTYTESQGSLPGNQATSIASTGHGAVIVGTDRGAALIRETGTTFFRVGGTAMANDRALVVAGDSDRIWVGGTGLAWRGVVALGKQQPVISGFAPGQATPGTAVTINGQFFDERGHEYNKVLFATIHGQAAYEAGEVLAATPTAITVRVPLTAGAGRIQVQSGDLKSNLSTNNFLVAPAITSLESACLGVGDVLRIHGAGFQGAGIYGLNIRLGNGAWNPVDSFDGVLANYTIRPTDLAGPVEIRLANGLTAKSTQSVTTSAISVAGVQAQQAIEGEAMIWGKHTLFQMLLKTNSVCSATVDFGFMEWVKIDGSTDLAGATELAAPGGLIVNSAAPSAALLSQTANMVARFDDHSDIFPLSQLSAVRFTLKRNGLTLLVHEIPAAQFAFSAPAVSHHLMNLKVIPTTYSFQQHQAYEANLWQGLRHVERNYPLPPSSGLWSDHEANWLYNWSGHVRSETAVNLDDDDQFADLMDWADDLREDANDVRCEVDGPCRPRMDQAVVIVANELSQGGSGGMSRVSCPNPFSDCDADTSVVFNTPGLLGRYYLHESTHSLGWVGEDSPNHHPNHEGRDLHHSKYDEGQTPGLCTFTRTYRQAVIDQLGAFHLVARLDDEPPAQLLLGGCDAADAKAVMSYAPNRTDRNVFLEPLDLQHIRSRIGSVAPPPAIGLAAAYTTTLRLNGSIDQAGQVNITMSRLLDATGDVSASNPSGAYQLRLFGTGLRTPLVHRFDLGGETAHNGTLLRGRFNLRVPVPAGIVRAEIYQGAQRLWTKTISANAPSAGILTPAGGSYSANDRVSIRWSARDGDGDPLQFALDYSPDNGRSWLPITTGLRGTSYEWDPGFMPASATARLRLRVSDGFRTTTAVSARFVLTGRKPLAFIGSPRPFAAFTEGQSITLVGGSQASGGANVGNFAWTRNGVAIGAAPKLREILTTPGTYTYELTVTADGQATSASVMVFVQPDYDRDGIPDGQELQHKLNPLDRSTGLSDPDNDGLNTAEELLTRANPRVADTDGDGVKDGVEFQFGTSPVDRLQTPNGRAVLRVGPENLVYRVGAGTQAVSQSQFWITNGGGGQLLWQAASDAPWLTLSAPSGVAPSKLTLNVNPVGLAPGVYTGAIRIVVSGDGSAHTITVRLDVVERSDGAAFRAAHSVYLPFVRQ